MRSMLMSVAASAALMSALAMPVEAAPVDDLITALRNGDLHTSYVQRRGGGGGGRSFGGSRSFAGRGAIYRPVGRSAGFRTVGGSAYRGGAAYHYRGVNPYRYRAARAYPYRYGYARPYAYRYGRPYYGYGYRYGRPYYGYRYGYPYRYGYYPGYYNYNYYDNSLAAGAVGLATGAIIGGALSQAGSGYRTASWCAQRYRSYDPASGTYLGYDGRRHACP